MSTPSKRRDIDVTKLMMSDYVVEPINDGIKEINVKFHGPKESPYEGGVWKVRVKLPDAYPYKYPKIRFLNRIFHPNISDSGEVCLDVIKETWSPMFDLLNVFEVFLPQLLLYPNPSSPLNNDAADLLMENKDAKYELKVKEYCARYAKMEHIDTITDGGGDVEVSDDEDSDGLSVSGDGEYNDGPSPRHVSIAITDDEGGDGEGSDPEDSDGPSASDDEHVYT